MDAVHPPHPTPAVHGDHETGRRDSGFTLIELLVVVIILGVLAAIAIPAYLNHRAKGLDATIKTDLRAAAEAAETITTEQPWATTNVFTAAAMRDAGFSRSDENYIRIAGSPAHGYCIFGNNPNSNATTGTRAFWWDSLKGGLKPGPPGPATGQGGSIACTNDFVLTYGWITLN